jgi:hypothetical protein
MPGWLLAPFPIITSILATFTHAQSGSDACRALLHGLVLGFFAFATFCFAVATLVESLGVAVAFTIATVAALVVQGVVLKLAPRSLPEIEMQR